MSEHIVAFPYRWWWEVRTQTLLAETRVAGNVTQIV
jgi:hypothetical protein